MTNLLTRPRGPTNTRHFHIECYPEVAPLSILPPFRHPFTLYEPLAARLDDPLASLRLDADPTTVKMREQDTMKAKKRFGKSDPTDDSQIGGPGRMRTEGSVRTMMDMKDHVASWYI